MSRGGYKRSLSNPFVIKPQKRQGSLLAVDWISALVVWVWGTLERLTVRRAGWGAKGRSSSPAS